MGDIESLPFLEAIRQMGTELGHDRALYMHLTLVPYIAASGEIKTKPTQHSVKELRSIGIQPDILLCRSNEAIPDEERRKIAMFTNVEERAVFSAMDVDDIYKLPIILSEQGLDEIVVEKLRLNVPRPNLNDWKEIVHAKANPTGEVDVAIVGKYVDLTEAYKSLNEALMHAGLHTLTKVKLHYIDSENIETDGTGCLHDMDAILVPGGFGERGVEGKIAAVSFARKNNIPYFGICLGMQVAVIEYARHQAGLADAHSTEFRRETANPVIALITEWKSAEGKTERRDGNSDLGGTMRLGGQLCRLKDGSLAQRLYDTHQVTERHRHRYEFNNDYLEQLEGAGLVISGRSEDGNLVEVIEVSDHPWFFACQFHPEFTSTPREGHPVFIDYIRTARTLKEAKT